MADTRSENAEMDIGRLNVRIDKVEEDLVVEVEYLMQLLDLVKICMVKNLLTIKLIILKMTVDSKLLMHNQAM